MSRKSKPASYYLTTPAASLESNAERAVQTMHFNALCESDPSNAATYRAEQARLAPKSVKAPYDKFAAAAKAQATRKAKTAAFAAAFLASIVTDSEKIDS